MRTYFRVVSIVSLLALMFGSQLCLLVEYADSVLAIDDGKVLYSFAFEHRTDIPHAQAYHARAIPNAVEGLGGISVR